MRTRIPPNEIGFSLCRTTRGKLVAGPVSQGTPTRVDISIACPPGSKFLGLIHTHPKLPNGQGGIADLSKTDMASAQRVKAKVSCVVTEGATNCFRVKKPVFRA